MQAAVGSEPSASRVQGPLRTRSLVLSGKEHPKVPEIEKAPGCPVVEAWKLRARSLVSVRKVPGKLRKIETVPGCPSDALTYTHS